LSTPLKYFNTIRNLTARQVIGQLRNRIRPTIEGTTSFFNKPVPAYPGCQWNPDINLPAPGGQSSRQPKAVSGEFTFLNRKRVGREPYPISFVQKPTPILNSEAVSGAVRKAATSFVTPARLAPRTSMSMLIPAFSLSSFLYLAVASL
jgi:hypothetical protein